MSEKIDEQIEKEKLENASALRKKNIRKGIIFISICFLTLLTFFFANSNINANKELNTLKINNLENNEKLELTLNKYEKLKNNSSLIELSVLDLENWLFDPKKYTSTSTKKKREIFNALKKYSKQYNINIAIFFTLTNNESSFRHTIKHSNIKVKVPTDKTKKKHKVINTNAVGLTGIVYEIWEYDLREAKIIETKSDLVDPDMNIHSSAFIIDYYRKMPLLPGTKTALESALLRYYGVLYEDNKTKVNKAYYINVNKFIAKLYEHNLFSTDEIKPIKLTKPKEGKNNEI